MQDMSIFDSGEIEKFVPRKSHLDLGLPLPPIQSHAISDDWTILKAYWPAIIEFELVPLADVWERITDWFCSGAKKSSREAGKRVFRYANLTIHLAVAILPTFYYGIHWNPNCSMDWGWPRALLCGWKL